MRRDSPLAEKETISPEDLWDTPYALTISSVFRETAARVSNLFSETGSGNVHFIEKYQVLTKAAEKFLQKP